MSGTVSPAEIPVFSKRLDEVLDTIYKGEAPNAGRFCGYCYTPIEQQRTECRHCRSAVAEHPPVDRIPKDVVEMFRKLRRRESLVVNSFAYLGLTIAVAVFIGVFYIIFNQGANVWWYAADTFLLFVLARVLPGIVGGWIGDEVGYSYAHRKLIEDWTAYAAKRTDASTSG